MAQIPVNNLKKNTYFHDEQGVYRVLDYSHHAMGRGGATIRIKVQDLVGGSIFEKTFKGNDTVEEADLQRVKAQYLYKDGENFVFMDSASFEQYLISEDLLGNQQSYLKDNLEVEMMIYESNPIAVTVPPKVDFRVIETDKGVKGDTATQASKPAVLETGLVVQVPLFIKQGDEIVVSTKDGSYAERKK